MWHMQVEMISQSACRQKYRRLCANINKNCKLNINIFQHKSFMKFSELYHNVWQANQIICKLPERRNMCVTDRVIQNRFNGNLPVSLRKVGWDGGSLFLKEDEFLAVASVFVVVWVSWTLDLDPLSKILWS